TVSGIISRIQPFGAFVDLGGVDGLVHVSELSWDRVEDPQHVVRVGQPVEVVVMEIDQGRDRIALSLRRASPDPMQEALAGVQMGTTVEGKVVRLTNFGAFVNIAPGVDGMIHVSDMAHHHVRHPQEILEVGAAVTTRVVKVDLERRRIGLSLKALGGDPWEDALQRYSKGKNVEAEVLRVERFGVFVKLADGLQALLPAREANLPQGRALAAAFRPGQTVKARVLRVDPREKKIALTCRENLEETSGPRSWKDQADSEEAADVGSFGALLAQALGDKPETGKD
ncbi:MAG: S1 RNA-binding domain-containing protein, partial [Myxococcota bacterium]|nr:S1 RNA-binding domain-containing protein [Myxococcota bacterium]